jgi:hypothetical protein
MRMTQNKRTHSYDADFLEIAVNNVNFFQNVNRSTPITETLWQKTEDRYCLLCYVSSAEEM